MNLIDDLHIYLADDIEKMNKLIIGHLASKEDLVKVVGKYLIEAGGKRIRPLLTILTSRMFGYRGEENIKLATAVEFIHAATLLHDDVVDNSKMRRFKPTANVLWGNKASILVGDFLFSQAFKLMVATNSLSALDSLSKASSIIAEGEVAQLEKLQQRRMINKNEYFEIIRAKTAELFGAACEVGAIISNQSPEVCRITKQFGVNLGSIFQIVDDLLDYFGNNKEIGKNIGDDFSEGKVTLPLIILYEKLDISNQQKIIKLLQSSKRTTEDFILIRQLLEEYLVKEEIDKELAILSQHTQNLIINNVVQNKIRDYLFSLVDFAGKRVY